MCSNMRAALLHEERRELGEGMFAELRLWRVPQPVHGSQHDLKYALARVVGGTCVLRYDNEAGKGDHRPIGGSEFPYEFSTMEQLLADFWNDVNRWSFE
ncbi:MAG TPA: DUF6516 family protein [Novosphingobium sp.]|nr:DUF6516 family protein [Novosphingobium sp.]